MVDSLQFIKSDTLDCSADLYWRIIAQGKEAIPFLIEKLTDTTQTKIKFHCKKTCLNVGEIAQFALSEIASFPPAAMGVGQFDFFMIDEQGQSCWSFYDYLFNNSKKEKYKTIVQNWYNKEISNYKCIIIPEKERAQCQKQFGITKYYRWRD